MPNRHRSPLAALLALAAVATLAACGQPPVAIDPATLSQDFSFRVANPDDLSGAIFAPVYEAFGTLPAGSAAGTIAPAQATAIRNAMDGATLATSGVVAGALTPAAELSRINELIGFFMGASEIYFVPDGCDVTTENASEAAFGMVMELGVWDGETLDEDGFPAATDGYLDLSVTVGAVTTEYFLAASRTAWSAATVAACEIDPGSWYELDLDVTGGWQFLRVTIDDTVDAERLVFETVSLEDAAAAGIIGLADVGGGGPILLGDDARRLTPIYR